MATQGMPAGNNDCQEMRLSVHMYVITQRHSPTRQCHQLVISLSKAHKRLLLSLPWGWGGDAWGFSMTDMQPSQCTCMAGGILGVHGGLQNHPINSHCGNALLKAESPALHHARRSVGAHLSAMTMAALDLSLALIAATGFLHTSEWHVSAVCKRGIMIIYAMHGCRFHTQPSSGEYCRY